MERQPMQSPALLQIVPLWVVSGINKGSNCGYHTVYSGTVAGAREAFFNGVPSISMSYDWVGGKSNSEDYVLAAEACLPLICGLVAVIKNNCYPTGCFLNIDLPTDIVNHKGYKLTKQGKSIFLMGWRKVTSETEGGNIQSNMSMDLDASLSSENIELTTKQGHTLFKRQITKSVINDEDIDLLSLQEGYITVTPLCGQSPAAVELQDFFKDWLLNVSEKSYSSAL
ncbi:hypothetical protein SAY87_029852 [Trapa incisa]|uniref:Survival protein SurE-like phosphatase/nucleotidase domain-containing protein n=1 Tax=Trapa incisa TaxID=236973 RepID=A0AAN7K559_9MYRT|nr:hypothetical protein SAY87_029852 [Trapa incisa]